MPPSALQPTNRMGNELDGQLRQLVAEACCFPRGSLERQQRLTRLVALVQKSGQLWRSPKTRTDDYEEALQQTWLHVCQKIETYDPQRASVMTWINTVLKYKLLDSGTKPPMQELPEHLSAGSEPPPILEEIQSWLQRERQNLRSVYVRDRLDINCHVLICDRLPPEKPWKQLSQEFGVSISTLSNFYQRECKPRLRRFLDSDE